MAMLVLVKSEVHTMTGSCTAVHAQLNFPLPLTVHERVRFGLTSSGVRTTGLDGTNSGADLGFFKGGSFLTENFFITPTLVNYIIDIYLGTTLLCASVLRKWGGQLLKIQCMHTQQVASLRTGLYAEILQRGGELAI